MAGIWQTYPNRGQKLEALVLKAKRLSAQLWGGSQPSIFKGRGFLFEEVRKYQPGDDVRTIHWSVTARLQETHVKLYNEEKNLTLWLLVDVSGSGLFGTRHQTKRDLITELCVVLAFAAQKSNYRVGAVFFSDKLEQVISPQRGSANCLKILQFLVNVDINGKQTRMSAALDHVLHSTRKGNLVVLLSDFLTKVETGPLQLLSRQHDLLGIRIYDPSEAQLPMAGYLQAIDAETGKTVILNTTVPYVRQSYQAWHRDLADTYRQFFASAGAGFLEVATNEDYLEKLKHYFHK